MLPGLLGQHMKQRQHRENRNDDLNHTPRHHSRADGTDLLTENVIPDQNRQHPVRPFYRNIAEVLLVALILKCDLPLPAVFKILPKLFIPGFRCCICIHDHGKKIISCLHISKRLVCQALSTAVIQVAVGLVAVGLQGQGA